MFRIKNKLTTHNIQYTARVKKPNSNKNNDNNFVLELEKKNF